MPRHLFRLLVQVRDLGLMEYGEALAVQLSIRDTRIRGDGEDTLLLVEHPPVATLGRRGAPTDVFDPTLPVHVIDRGGKATYHAPGQVVMYPIVHLGEGNRDVRAWVQHLESLVITLLQEAGIQADIRTEQPGIWTSGGKKIASLGIAIQGWVSTHGLALNVTNDVAEFSRINPCGLGAEVMTNMDLEGSSWDVARVKSWLTTHAPGMIQSFLQERKHVPVIETTQ